MYYQEHSSVQIRFSDLVRLCPLTDLHTALFEHPEDTIGCLTAAVMIVTAINGVVNSHLHVRILDFEPLTAFKDIKSNFVGKLVAVQGTIIRVGGIKSQVMKMNFECETCGAVMQVVGCHTLQSMIICRPLWMENTKPPVAVEMTPVEVALSAHNARPPLLRIGKLSN